MDAKVVGTVMPVLEVALDPGEVVFSESGEALVDDGIHPDEDLHPGRWRRGLGGVFSGLSRAARSS